MTRNLRVTPVATGNCSPGVGTPASTSAIFGNVRSPLETGGNTRNRAPVPSSTDPVPLSGRAVPASYSSHEYVRGSLSASVAVAERVKGVPGGIAVLGVLEVITGMLFAVAVSAAYVEPPLLAPRNDCTSPQLP